MNREKLNNWIKLANYLGLIYEVNVSVHVNILDPTIFFEIMKLYSIGTKERPITHFIENVNSSFLPFDYEVIQNNEIPDPYSFVLKNLHLKNKIQLDTYGNYPEYKFENDRMEENVPHRFNVYSVL